MARPARGALRPLADCYDRFARWRGDGTWDRLLVHVQTKLDAVGKVVWEVSVDSTVARAHQHAAGARRRAPWGVLGEVLGLATWAPAGGIVGALVGSATLRLLTGRPVPADKFQTGVQAFSGGIIGLDVSSNFLGELVKLA